MRNLGRHCQVFSLLCGIAVAAGTAARAQSLAWNTFLGGSSVDDAWAVVADAAGGAFVTGRSFTTWGVPVRPYSGSVDAYVAHLDAAGTIVWSTFLGGAADDYPFGMTLDQHGNLYVVGFTAGGWGNPVRPFGGGVYDGFVAKLDGTTGALLWTTMLGGDDSDQAWAATIGADYALYVAGIGFSSWGTPVLPYVGPGRRAWVARLDGASGAVDWNTFLGAWDANAIALHGGSVYVACAGDGTWGAPVRPYTGGFDGCVASLDAATGALGWNTFLGGSGDDGSNGIAVDAIGRVFVSGSSESTWGAPVRPFTGGTDGFVAQLDPAGTLVWNTFLGGAGVDQISPLAIDGNGRVLVGGSSDASWGNPLRPYSAGTDAFVASVDPGSGALGWNLFLGGAGNDRAGLLLASGPGEIYVAGTSSAPWGSPLRAFTAVQDGFLARLVAPTAVPAVAPRGLVLLALVLAALGLVVARRLG